MRAVWCSIGRLLKLSGVSVTSIKIDPYLVRAPPIHFALSLSCPALADRKMRCPRLLWHLQNTDAGTMSPFEHGEVFVLDDGGEVKNCWWLSVCLLSMAGLTRSKHDRATWIWATTRGFWASP